MFIESFLSVENDLLLFANKLYMAETKLDFPGLFQLILLLNVKLFGVAEVKLSSKLLCDCCIRRSSLRLLLCDQYLLYAHSCLKNHSRNNQYSGGYHFEGAKVQKSSENRTRCGKNLHFSDKKQPIYER